MCVYGSNHINSIEWSSRYTCAHSWLWKSCSRIQYATNHKQNHFECELQRLIMSQPNAKLWAVAVAVTYCSSKSYFFSFKLFFVSFVCSFRFIFCYHVTDCQSGGHPDKKCVQLRRIKKKKFNNKNQFSSWNIAIMWFRIVIAMNNKYNNNNLHVQHYEGLVNCLHHSILLQIQLRSYSN